MSAGRWWWIHDSLGEDIMQDMLLGGDDGCVVQRDCDNSKVMVNVSIYIVYICIHRWNSHSVLLNTWYYIVAVVIINYPLETAVHD